LRRSLPGFAEGIVGSPMFEKMSCAERIELAKKKMERVLDHFLSGVNLFHQPSTTARAVGL